MKVSILITIITSTIFMSCDSNKDKTNVPPLHHYVHWHKRVIKFIEEKDSIKTGSYIFLGNSITEGFNLQQHFPNVNTVNRGISSDHIDGVSQRLNLSIKGAKSAKLFILMGINDIGAGRSKKTIKALYSNMVDSIVKNYNYDVYLQSILPTSPRWANCPPNLIKNINEFIKDLATDKGLTYVDLYPLFQQGNTNFIKGELVTDGLHLNEEGYRIWSDYLKSVIK